jgi:hypothetical protein
MKSQKINRKGVVPIIVLAFLAIAGAIFFGVVNLGTITGTGDYLERPIFKYVKCEAVGSQKETASIPLSNPNGEWLSKPTVSEKYTISADIGPKDFLFGRTVQVSICNSRVLSTTNCQKGDAFFDQNNNRLVITDISPDKFVWLKVGPDSVYKKSSYRVKFIPFGLREYDVLSGSAKQLNPNDCTLNTQDIKSSDQYVSSTSQKIKSTTSGASGQKISTSTTFDANEVRWYVSGYVTSAGPSFRLKYNNYDAWCRSTGQSAEIYRINSLSTAGKVYYVASADYSDLLGTETCCPGQKVGDATCGSDFKWKTTANAECSTFNPCGGAEWAPSTESGQLIRYKCVTGKCQAVTKNVECTRASDCNDNNKVCDLNTYTCVNANVNLDGSSPINIIPDNSMDCEKKGGKWITKTTQDKSWLNYIGIGSPKPVVTEYCDFGNGVPWTTILTTLIIIGIVFIFVRFRYLIRGFLRL